MDYQDLTKDILKQYPAYDGHQIVRKCVISQDPEITAYIAVHNTNLGPGLGGCRVRAYKNEADAMHDVLRLSKGMTYKNALADLPLGGGKAVIVANPRTQKNPDLMQRFGDMVESLEGLYVTAEDSGTSEDDMEAIAQSTQYVTGLHPKSKNDLGGNPSPLTAIGTYEGILSAVKFQSGKNSLSGLKVAVQGVGAVGFALCQLLHDAGAHLIVADIDDNNIQSARDSFSNIEIVNPDQIHSVQCDILAPCAMGGVLNDTTIPEIKASIIAGAANNQLATKDHDKAFKDKNIIYVPDYVINSGGVICVGYEYFQKSGYNPKGFSLDKPSMQNHVQNIGQTVHKILAHAKDQNMPTGQAADALAEGIFLNAQSHSKAI